MNLGIEKKEDSPKKIAETAGKPSKNYLFAAEVNKIVKSIQEIYPTLVFKGDVNLASEEPTEPGIYPPTQSGVYFGDVTIDLTEGFNVIIYDGVNFTKQVVPIDLASYAKVASIKNYPIKETGLVLQAPNAPTNQQMQDFLVDMFLEGNYNPALTYSLGIFQRANASWVLRVYSTDGSPGVISDVCQLSTSVNPEDGDKITFHDLSEIDSSGVTGKIAVNWSKIPTATTFYGMYDYNGYGLDIKVWDKANATYINQSPSENELLSLPSIMPMVHNVFAIENDTEISKIQGSLRSNYMQRLYREGFVNEEIELFINGFEKPLINKKAGNENIVEQVDIPLKLTAEGYVEQNTTFKFIKTKAIALTTKQIRMLAVGDSIASQSYFDENGVGSYSFSDLVRVIMEKFNKDSKLYWERYSDVPDALINCLTMGTQAVHDNIFNYRGEDISIKGGTEGRGGWTTASYLRHCTNTIAVDIDFDASWFNNFAAWASLGLGKKIVWNSTSEANGYGSYTGITFVEYNGSETHRLLIRDTPHGYYLPDLNANLWTSLKNKMGYSSSLGGSYSTGQHPAMMVAMKDLIEQNPKNPFFDVALARSTGQTSFSVLKYLSRHRTMDNNGSRLYGASGGQAYYDAGLTNIATGYTVGTKVIDTLAYNVTKPTHLVLNITGNDFLYGNYIDYLNVGYPERTVAELASIASICTSQISDAFVCFTPNRKTGSIYPSENYFSNDFDTWLGKMFYEVAGLIYSANPLPINNRISVLPTHFTLPSTTASDGEKCIDFLTGETIWKVGSDNGHFGYNGLHAIAYDVASWIAYTQTL